MSASAHEAKAVLKHSKDGLNDLRAEAVDYAKDMVSGVRDSAQGMVDSAGDQVRQLSSAAADAISSKPFKAVCIAIGVGFAIGLIIRGKR